MKKWKIESYSALCDLEVFTIDGIEAHWGEFGDKYDTSPETAEDYACGNMQFMPKDPEIEVLVKYMITKEEYFQICEELREALSFGSCGWCV